MFLLQRFTFGLTCILLFSVALRAQQLQVADIASKLDIRLSGEHSIRITLAPVGYKDGLPFSPALAADRNYDAPVISIQQLAGPITKTFRHFIIKVNPNPLTVKVMNERKELVQELTFLQNGTVAFKTDDGAILGMGEGGPKPEKNINWRNLPIQFSRKGQLDKMEPRWQSDAYGSRNPAAVLVCTSGWALFMATPWVQVDLREKDRGIFIPWQPAAQDSLPQTEKNQGLVQSKGLPPANKVVTGLYDCFVFDAHQPADFMKDFSNISGPAVLPPKWALGYMQSHRTLQDETEMLGIIDSFRAKKIPLDAVIYLGTGFTPRGWNKQQPSFEFNPDVFKRQPKLVLEDMHARHVKVVLHMVPWDRDKLPTLQGNIPARPGEPLDASHIQTYWQQHISLINTGVDAFWPDEGDWFNLFERIKRHQLYYQGPLSTRPNVRPWSLHRNGYPGIAQWGGWVWSGDTESSWKTLEGQVAVGINYSLSISPYWGSDIGGFYANAEKTGELYARWYQFGAFCPSFRSHGRTWHTSLPWGWGLSDMGVRENNNNNTDGKYNVLQSEMNNPTIEPITKKYTELRYQLLPYNYSLAWEARNTGMPLMRALWLHYPNDEQVKNMGSEYLWGRDMLIAPVFKKGVANWSIYLPKGQWYDWWTNEKITGSKTIIRPVDLATMPIYMRAGAIIPFDPVRQYTDETVSGVTTLKVYAGANGDFTLYEDDGISQEYLVGKAAWTHMAWNDKTRKLVLEPQTPKGFKIEPKNETFKVQLIPDGVIKMIHYTGKKMVIDF